MNSRDTYATSDFVDLIITVGTTGFVLAGSALQAPDFLMSGRAAVDGAGVAFVLLCDMQTTHYLMDQVGAVRGTIPQGGRGSCALFVNDGRLEVHAQGATDDGGATCLITVYDAYHADAEGRLQAIDGRAYRAQYGGEGILQVMGPASLRSSANDGMTFPNDIVLRKAITADGWWCGQINRIPPGGGNEGTVGVVSPQGNVFIAALQPGWNGYTNWASYLAVKDGKPRVAMSDPDPFNATPGPDDIKWIKLDANGNVPQPGEPEPDPDPPPVDVVTTYIVTLEKGEKALIEYVERRGPGSMVRKLRAAPAELAAHAPRKDGTR